MKGLIFVVLFLPIFTFGQEEEHHEHDGHNHEEHLIKGVVMEQELDSLYPIIGANIQWLESGNQAISDDEGHFEIEHEFNDIHLIVSTFNYKPDTLVYNNEEFISVVFDNSVILVGVEVVESEGMLRLQMKNPFNVLNMDQQDLRKAACCNLAESFETNPAVDASLTDAVTGTKQIKMLGLAGKYVQIMQDNIPMVRGLSTIYGLEFYPGAWINGIQVSKGAGSVVNGYESMTGQINLNMKNSDNSEKLFFNLYGSQAGRMEANVNASVKVNENWTSTLLLHGKLAKTKWDNNNDGFLDSPLSENFNVNNQWNYRSNTWHIELGAGYANLNSIGGQVDFDPKKNLEGLIYGVESSQLKASAFAKFGYLFPNDDYRSLALQLAVSNTELNNSFDVLDYYGLQQSGYANLIFQDEVGESEMYYYKAGLSLNYDYFDEKFAENPFQRTEIVPGAFLEGTYEPTCAITIIGGLRADFHNLYGTFLTPRLHARFSPTEHSSFKLAVGRGQRTPNVFTENIGYFASNRSWSLEGSNPVTGFELSPEVAWNFGLNYTGKFELFHRPASVTIDLYRTQFENQVVVDLENANEVRFYNLDGESFSNSGQIEFDFEPIKRVSVYLAYRYLDVKMQYKDGLKQVPMLARNRGFINLEYQTKENDKGGKWKFDITGQAIGKQRLPSTINKAPEFQLAEESPVYGMINAQITKVFSNKFEIYLGGENLTNYRQSNPILSNDDPFSSEFDASIIWAPVFGRMVYGGLRFSIN